MTTTKPAQPATPLPYSLRYGADISNFQKGKIFIVSGSGLDRLQLASMTKGPTMRSDAVYFVAACNAYPRLLAERAELVAALRELHAIDERKLTASEKRTYKIGHSAIHGRVERNRALLRKLGAE